MVKYLKSRKIFFLTIELGEVSSLKSLPNRSLFLFILYLIFNINAFKEISIL